MKKQRFRWWLWSQLIRFPSVCNAKAHGLLIWNTHEDPRIDQMCRDDCERNGSCWCGKIRSAVETPEPQR